MVQFTRGADLWRREVGGDGGAWLDYIWGAMQTLGGDLILPIGS